MQPTRWPVLKIVEISFVCFLQNPAHFIKVKVRLLPAMIAAYNPPNEKDTVYLAQTADGCGRAGSPVVCCRDIDAA
jgi:hypothetical protein